MGGYWVKHWSDSRKWGLNDAASIITGLSLVFTIWRLRCAAEFDLDNCWAQSFSMEIYVLHNLQMQYKECDMIVIALWIDLKVGKGHPF